MDATGSNSETSGKKRYKLLPPNDPTRKDWGILSDSLGLKSHVGPKVGSTPEQAAEEMKQLLLRCTQSNESYEALIMKCAGTAIGRRLQEGGQYAEVMMFLKSRLWNRRRDGQRTKSQKGREASSNDVLLAWDPASGGVGKYLQVNITNILARDWTQSRYEVADPARESLDRLQESGLEPDNSGRFVDRSSATFGQEDAPDYVENDEDIERAALRLSGAVDQRDEIPAGEELEVADAAPFEPDADLGVGPIPEGPGGPSRPSAVTPARQAFEVAAAASAHTTFDSPLLRTTENPDFALFSAALMKDGIEPELDLKGRVAQLRTLGGEVIDLHLQDSPDLQEVNEALATWDPSRYTFARFFPEVIDEIGVSLDTAGPDKVVARDCDLDLAIDAVETTPAIDEAQVPEKPRGMSQREWRELAESTRDWFSAEAQTEEELTSSTRPDYLALCLRTGRAPEGEIPPAQLAQDLKKMAATWLGPALAKSREVGSSTASVFAAHSETIMEMRRRLETWDPMRGFLGEEMRQHLHEIRIERMEREQLEAQAEIRAHLDARGQVSNLAPKLPRRAKLPEPSEQFELFGDASPPPAPVQTISAHSQSRPRLPARPDTLSPEHLPHVTP